MHSAEDYDSYIAPLRRRWPNPLLRFTILDESSAQTAPRAASERLSLYSALSIPLSDATSKLPSPVASRHSCVLPLNSQSFIPPPPPPPATCVLPPLPSTMTPPSPIIFSPASNRSRSPHQCTTKGTTPYCPIAKGKADIEILLSSFKEDLERILYRTFGSGCVEQEFAPLTKGSSCGISGDDIIPLATSVPASVGDIASRWCFVCRTSFTGVWYGCIRCPWHAVVSRLLDNPGRLFHVFSVPQLFLQVA